MPYVYGPNDLTIIPNYVNVLIREVKELMWPRIDNNAFFKIFNLSVLKISLGLVVILKFCNKIESYER